MVRNGHPPHQSLVFHDLLAGQDHIQRRQIVPGGKPGDRHLLLELRVVDADEEHEPVELGLGQRIGAFLLDGVLGGKHEERPVQFVGPPDHSHHPLLHRLQQRGLGLRRRAVDLVRQHDVGENRSLHELKLTVPAARFLQDVSTGNVRRHQVGGELDTAEGEIHGLGQGVDHQRLGQTRHTHQQAMSAGQNAGEQALDHILLALDHPGQFGPHPPEGLAQLVDRGHVVGLRLGGRRLGGRRLDGDSSHLGDFAGLCRGNG